MTRAEKVAHDLFTDGEGRTYCHLSLDNDKELGWGEHVLADRIQKAIESAVAEAVERVPPRPWMQDAVSQG